MRTDPNVHEHHVLDRASPTNQGRIFFRLKDKKRSRQPDERDGGHSGASPEGCRKFPGLNVFMQISADHPHRRSLSPSRNISTRCSRPTRRSSTGAARKLESTLRDTSGIPGRHQRPAGEESAARRSKSTTTEPYGAGRLSRSRSRTRSTPPTVHSPDLAPSTRLTISTTSSSNCCRNYQQRCLTTLSLLYMSAPTPASWCLERRSRSLAPCAGPLIGESPGPACRPSPSAST